MQKHIIKSIAQMIVVELQQIKKSWKNIMKKKLLRMAQKDYASNARPD
jgi:hypothetical protein